MRSLASDVNPSGFRIPEPLREQIKAAAKRNRRSMSGEVVARLEDSFALEPPDHPVLAGHARPGPPPRVLTAAELADRAAPAYDDASACAQLADLLARLSLADRAVALRVIQALLAA